VAARRAATGVWTQTVSLFFQPRSTSAIRRNSTTNPSTLSVAAHDPLSTVHAALEALTLGDGSRLEQLFTEDIQFRSPHVSARSRAEVLHDVCSPESALTDLEITLSHVVTEGSIIAAEWRVEAVVVSAVLFGDNVLIEPSKDRLQLPGSAFVEFSDQQIRSLRCYFDDSEMFDRVPGVEHPLRFTARW
jgi:ketosteroid isomerase-like protein